MKNDLLCSLEQAKKLKEIGFNESSPSFYQILSGTTETRILHELDYPHNQYKNEYAAPSVLFVAEWLRQEKGIYLCINCTLNWDKWFVTIHNKKEAYWSKRGITFDSYEDALSAGVDAAIEILEVEVKK